MDVLTLNEQWKCKYPNQKKRITKIHKQLDIPRRNVQNWITKGVKGINDNRKKNPGKPSQYIKSGFYQDFSKEFVKRVKRWTGKFQHDTIFKFLMPQFYLD